MCVPFVSDTTFLIYVIFWRISAAWTTFGSQYIHTTWAWRLPSILQGLPAMVQICLVWFMPESPRWLVSKGRDAQALQTLAYYHADGNAYAAQFHLCA